MMDTDKEKEVFYINITTTFQSPEAPPRGQLYTVEAAADV